MVRQRKSKKNRHNGEAEEDKENETTKVNESLVKFKQEKSKCKTGFTKARHGLLQLLEEDLPSRREVREARSKLNDRLDKVMEALVNLSTYYENRKDIDNVIKVSEEIEQIEREYSAAQNRTQEYFDARKDEASSATSEAFSENTDGAKQHKTYTQKWVEESFRSPIEVEEKRHNQELTKDAKPDNSEKSNIPDAKKKETKPADLAHDLWRQLKRVSIPVFTGNKAHYENWKAAFIACIDSAPATAEYKLLQLRQYLAGEALKVIESLGHSATAYEAAKSRLDRKYGGKRRQVALDLEEIENLKPLRQGNPKDIEHFADILDVAIINLKEAGRHEELGNGSLYLKLLKKMTTQMLTQYNRWIFESSKTECVETLREWVLQEAEFQTVASETLRGLLTPKQNTHTFFAKTEQETRDKRKCKLCEKGDHPLWRCFKFKGMSVEDRWNNAKHLRVCYRCLRGNHIGSQCTRTRVCGLNGCQESHDRLLHKEKPANRYASVRDEQTTSGTEGEPQVQAERTHTTTLTTAEEPKNDARHIALRTVPVVVSNGRREIVINALLDDGSTKTYINSDVAFELGLHGEVRNVTVNVLNGEENVFKSMPVTFNLKSVDGKTSTRMSAFTTDRVTGDLQPIDWRRKASKWKHLTGIHFPRLGRRPVTDMLIGIDHAELHYSLRDVRGKSGQPIARLTPLGWTCIGGHNACGGDTVNFNATFFLSSADQEISSTLQRFWEIETAGTEKQKPNYTLDEISALKQVERSIHFKDGRYEVSMPWQTDKIDLPDNYSMAVKRLEHTEKRLLKNKEIGEAYSNTIQDYLKKGYISKVEKAKSYEDEESRQQWFLPHFSLVKPDRTTTKVRLIFDASAKHDGVCLNDVIHKGPKLQRELFDVLLRFRRYPYALVGDIAEMYLRIGISPECRPFHRFLWRDLDTSKTPQVYQFNSLVFGVNSCPFQAQFVSRYHAEKNKDSFPKAANTILESTYMDDSMDSAPTESECIEVYQQLSKLWGSAGMYARKWLSNSAHVLLEVPEEDRATHVNLDEGHLPSIKTLGVM